MNETPNDHTGLKPQRSRHKEFGHPPDDFSSSMQDDRVLEAEIGVNLGREDEEGINHIFRKANANPYVYQYISRFLHGKAAFVDLRLDRERLAPELIQNRIRAYITDNFLDQWVKASLSPQSEAQVMAMVAEIQQCVGGGRLAKSLLSHQSGYAFFHKCLGSPEPVIGAKEVASMLDGSQSEPDVAAEIVYDFVRAIRDKGRKSVWMAFFEGFAMEASLPTTRNATFKVKWSSAPMLRALVEDDQQDLAKYYEEFIRTYLREQMSSTDVHIGDWQRCYDQHFQMLLNIQSGMFSPHASYVYGRGESSFPKEQ